MFDIGPMDLLVLGIVGILVFGPDRLPGLARDAARVLRSLRDLAIGTRDQFGADLDPNLRRIAQLSDLDVRKALAALLADDPPEDNRATQQAPEPASRVELTKQESTPDGEPVRQPAPESQEREPHGAAHRVE